MNVNKEFVLGVDIGGTNMRFGLVDAGNGIRAFERVSTRDTFEDGCDPAEKLGQCILFYCARNLGREIPAAVSIGFPSTINRQRTVVVQTPNIPCIPDNFHVVEILQEKLGVPVFINRDVNNLLLFDLDDLEVSSRDCVAGIYFGTGIGNAVIVGGKLLLGRNGVAAELGHLPVYGNTRLCMCGNVSCLETVISGIALERIQAEHFPETPINCLFSRHAGTPEIHSFVEGMGQAVASEANLFDPDCMILGGGLLQMPDFPQNELEAAVHRYARKPYPERTLDLRYSRPNQANGAIGAAIYARKRMADPQYL